MSPKYLRSLFVSLLAFCLSISAGPLASKSTPVLAGLTAHEWGTFTSITGEKGQAAEWSPLAGSTDLPSFVEHFRDAGFKLRLRGTVRMETPVLYFYDSRQETVSVKLSFAKGVITEWYPRASRVEPSVSLYDASLNGHHPDGSIAWNSVAITPGLKASFPAENQESHYYAARQTAATPVLVKTTNGEQQEKFLFYRGVANFAIPFTAQLTLDGKILIDNRGSEEIPQIILFERRGNKLGFRVGGAVNDRLTLDPPALTETVESLTSRLEEILVSRGLYLDEARAMLATWQNSWFEEGSRLLYIVPPGFVNSVVPLSIHPAPSQTVRVFVGRLELVTSATTTAVEQALATNDQVTLDKYGRFLEPILQTMLKKESDSGSCHLQDSLNAYWRVEAAKNQRRNSP